MERLTGEQAALVFRRAAELEATREANDPDARLDLHAVEEAGREAGLSPMAVRQAVAELRARGVPGTPAAEVAVTDVVADRTVDGPPRPVYRAVGDYLERELFAPARDLGDRVVWLPERGIEAAVERRVEGVDLRTVRRVVAAVVPVPGDGRTHVRLEAEVPGPALTTRVGVPVALAAAGGAAGVVEPLVGMVAVVAGVALAVVGWGSARAKRRAARAQVAEALAEFLDWLDRP